MHNVQFYLDACNLQIVQSFEIYLQLQRKNLYLSNKGKNRNDTKLKIVMHNISPNMHDDTSTKRDVQCKDTIKVRKGTIKQQ